MSKKTKKTSPKEEQKTAGKVLLRYKEPLLAVTLLHCSLKQRQWNNFQAAVSRVKPYCKYSSEILLDIFDVGLILFCWTCLMLLSNAKVC